MLRKRDLAVSRIVIIGMSIAWKMAKLSFTDVDGNMFGYEVIELETLSPFAIEEMTGGNWDLTLFTCTVGGQYRVTIRCVLANGGA